MKTLDLDLAPKLGEGPVILLVLVFASTFVFTCVIPIVHPKWQSKVVTCMAAGGH